MVLQGTIAAESGSDPDQTPGIKRGRDPMISTQKQFLFVHVPKTGGNSLQCILAAYSDDEIVAKFENEEGLQRFMVRNRQIQTTKHSNLSRYKEVLDTALYESLFKFATIRNPWDRMISLYFSPHRGVSEWDRARFLELVSRVPTLRHYVSEMSFGEKLREKIGLQSRNPRKRLDEDLDVLLRFEHLSEDFGKVCERLGIPVVPLPKRNASVREHYSKYYDDELRMMVEDKFREEIEIGNYSFTNS
jgi:hypothetical protein